MAQVVRHTPDGTGRGITAAADEVAIVGVLTSHGHHDSAARPIERLPRVLQQEPAQMYRPAAAVSIVKWHEGSVMGGRVTAYARPVQYIGEQWVTVSRLTASGPFHGGNTIALPGELVRVIAALTGYTIAECIPVHDRYELA